jgi:DNA-binding HxlR family transcriptional regulator
MAATKGYGQYCPISIAAEVMAERWTPLVLRGLFCGASRYSDIQASVPRMSSALLSRRLKELEYAGIIERFPAAKGKGSEYRLTPAGSELFPVLDKMGAWAQKWLRREITRDKNLDPDVLMWELRQTVIGAERKVEKRRVVQFQLAGVTVAKRFYWLVFEPDDVDICIRDPGYEIDLWINAPIRVLVEIWLGHITIAKARRDGTLKLDGSPAQIKAFPIWFSLSHFAAAGRDEAATATQ